jgi:Holliday junction resolvase RusA-like endonuclease
MSEVLTIIVLLLKWFFGAKAERAQRAKELSNLFSKVQKDGDNLGKQVWDNLSKKSAVDWEDIKLREP